MAERHQKVQKYTAFEIGGATKHCGPSESRFVTLHIHPFQMWMPSASFTFGVVRS